MSLLQVSKARFCEHGHALTCMGMSISIKDVISHSSFADSELISKN